MYLYIHRHGHDIEPDISRPFEVNASNYTPTFFEEPANTRSGIEEILTCDANTEYLRSFLHGSSDKELFKKNVPLGTYEDFKPYISPTGSLQMLFRESLLP
ncbi:hypothetical protein YC2023_088020 [Brassica napus]